MKVFTPKIAKTKQNKKLGREKHGSAGLEGIYKMKWSCCGDQYGDTESPYDPAVILLMGTAPKALKAGAQILLHPGSLQHSSQYPRDGSNPSVRGQMSASTPHGPSTRWNVIQPSKGSKLCHLLQYG